MSDSINPRDLGVIVRNTKPEDISKIINLQIESYPYLSPYGNIWRSEELESHLRIFPQGQFVAVEPDGIIVGSASTLIASHNPEYTEHTWKDITADGINYNSYSNRKHSVFSRIYLHIQNIDMKVSEG